MLSNEEQGMHDCEVFYKGKTFGGFVRDVKAEDAMRLFWPPVKEMMTQISMPYPKDRKEWLAGFKKKQAEILVQDEF